MDTISSSVSSRILQAAGFAERITPLGQEVRKNALTEFVYALEEFKFVTILSTDNDGYDWKESP
ncbi:hypothetical protein MASR1M46_12720 [Bacteroidales bacterium]